MLSFFFAGQSPNVLSCRRERCHDLTGQEAESENKTQEGITTK